MASFSSYSRTCLNSTRRGRAAFRCLRSRSAALAARLVVFGPITLDEEDAVNLREINASGIRVYMHQVPEDPFAELEPVLAKAGL